MGLAVAGAAVCLWLIAFGPLRGHLTTMDPRWASMLAGKDYIFPFDWTFAFWAINLGYLAIIVAIFLYRRRRVAVRREAGLVAGAIAHRLHIPGILGADARVDGCLRYATADIACLLDAICSHRSIWRGCSPTRPAAR